MALLEVNGLSKSFGGLIALENVGFQLDSGQILGIIGPNGAGKTTLFNLITGYLRPTKGKVFFKEQEITSMSPHAIVKAGLSRTFQLTAVFADLTVRENVLVALHLVSRRGYWRGLVGRAGGRRDGHASAKAEGLINFMCLERFIESRAGNLPVVHQKSLACAIAMASEPQVLLLDEPMSGLSAEETMFMMGQIRKIRAAGTSILLIEHKMRALMGLSERVVVLEFGRKLAEGTPGEISADARVIAAYLGNEK